MDLNEPKPSDSSGVAILHDCAKGIAFVSAVAIAVMLILFLVGWLHVRSAPPTDTELMRQLVETVKTDPDNAELITQFRAMDVVARRAQFQWFHFSRRGAALLLVALACLFGSLKLMGSLRKELPRPSDEDVDDGRMMARWSVLGGMVILVLFFFVFVKRGIPRFEDAVVVTPGSSSVAPTSKRKSELASVAELEASWPAFRGYAGLGVAINATLPSEWDGPSKRGLLWATELPLSGFNSPIVWKDRIFCTGADAVKRMVYCLDGNTGKVVWETAVRAVLKPADAEISEDTGFAAATMACNGGYVYAIFGGGELVCLDLTGAIVWRKDFGFPTISYGYSSSIRCFDNLVFVQQDHEPHRRVVALDAHSGHVVWEAKRVELIDMESGDGMQACWSSPVVTSLNGSEFLILNGNPEVRAYDPRSGALRWSWNGMGGEVATSVGVVGDKVLLAQEYARAAVLRISDGKPVWENDDVDVPDVSSPIGIGDLVFLPSSGGVLTCMGAIDGKVKWTHEYEEGFYASPIAVGDTVLLINRKGHAVVIKAADVYTEVSNHRLGENCVATPALVGSRLYVRGLKRIHCFGK